MAFLSIENRRDLPKVSYSTALDHFLNMCFAFVLASIIQFAGVHFFTKHGSGEIFPDSDSEDEETSSLVQVPVSNVCKLNFMCALKTKWQTRLHGEVTSNDYFVYYAENIMEIKTKVNTLFDNQFISDSQALISSSLVAFCYIKHKFHRVPQAHLT